MLVGMKKIFIKQLPKILIRENEMVASKNGLSSKNFESRKMPALFVGHGSPMVAIEPDDYNNALQTFARSIPKPKAIVVFFFFFETMRSAGITVSERPSLIYDFYGFPRELYELTYPCPGDPLLARRIAGMLQKEGFPVALNNSRGLDHGAWIPLRIAYPEADIPVIQISIPRPFKSQQYLKMAETLDSLREEGILFVGSGNIVHNLRMCNFFDKHAPVDEWALEFDFWVKDCSEDLETDKLVKYRDLAPHNLLAVPTTEHFDPLFFVMGFVRKGDPYVEPIFEGFHHANISMRCLAVMEDD